MHDRRILLAREPIRVLQVDPNANTPPYDRALCAALAAAGCDVRLLTSRFLYEPLGAVPGVRVEERFFRVAGAGLAARVGLAGHPLARRAVKAAEYPLDWLVTLAALARTRQHRPDVVHVQWSVQPRLDLLVWRWLRKLGLPLVYTAHNLIPHAARPADARSYGRLYRAANALVVHSERSALALRERWGVPAERVAVVPHGPLLEGTPAVERVAARRQLGLPVDGEIVLFAGLIEPYKGLANLIDGFASVAARRPSARLVVAGKPNEPFEPYRRQLADLGLLGRTTLDLRFLPEPALAAYLCAANVVALPYRAATSSGVLFAARRFGRAVVASAVGDLSEIVVDGESGLLAPPSSPGLLGAAVERLLADLDLADRLGRAGREAALGPEGWPEAAARTLRVYRRLLG